MEKITQIINGRMRPRGSQTPRLYGLAKVHKESIPLRPVLSMPVSVYYDISKEIADHKLAMK